jgi:peptidoglycan/LPS O-acetylase OafA/YrhL
MTTNNYYMPQLDSLRAIAVFSVLFQHYTSSTIHWGSYGVTLFFVLSGFLITRIILMHKQKMSEGVKLSTIARNFYIRRALRLFPIYYLTLILGCVFGFGMVCETLPWHLTYTSNFLFFIEESWLGIVSPYWSLANEEQFYILWFWIPLFLCSKNVIRVCLLIILFAISYRYTMDAIGQSVFAKLLLPGIFDSFAIGALLATAERWRPFISNYSRPLFLSGVSLFFLLVFIKYQTDIIPAFLFPTIVSLSFGMVIAAASVGVNGLFGKVLENNLLIYIGKISYGIYVMHTFAPAIFGRLPYVWRIQTADDIYQFLAYTLLTLFLASLSWRYLEGPINRKKAKFSEGVGSI